MLWLLAGCWNVQEEMKHRRVWEMQDHEADLYAGRDAIARGDLAQAKVMGQRFAERDPMPGLPDGVAPILEQLRTEAKGLADAPDLDTAAAVLTSLTGHCAACHAKMKVPTPQVEEVVDLLWIGVAFENEDRWRGGVAALGSAPDQATWPERRTQLAIALRHP